MRKSALRGGAVLALLLVGSVGAIAAPPLVTSVTINLGTPVHLTPTGFDSGGIQVPLAASLCTVVGFPNVLALPASVIVVTYDSTGAILTAAGPGNGTAQWKCQNGGAVVTSASFAVTVPWNVVAVGDTSP